MRTFICLLLVPTPCLACDEKPKHHPVNADRARKIHVSEGKQENPPTGTPTMVSPVSGPPKPKSKPGE
jgi:hypothetical protein